MANITKTNTRKNTVELRTILNNDGTHMENVYIDGQFFCCMGSVNERDKQAALETIQKAIDGSSNMYEAAKKLMNVACINDSGNDPTEQIEVQGHQLLIDYNKKLGCDERGNELVNCAELNITDHTAIKEILKARYEALLATETVFCDEEEEEEGYDTAWD